MMPRPDDLRSCYVHVYRGDAPPWLCFCGSAEVALPHDNFHSRVYHVKVRVQDAPGHSSDKTINHDLCQQFFVTFHLNI